MVIQRVLGFPQGFGAAPKDLSDWRAKIGSLGDLDIEYGVRMLPKMSTYTHPKI